MRNLIVTSFLSMDGVMQAPGEDPGYRNAGWTFTSVDFNLDAYEIKGREQEEATAVLLGRVSYETFAPAWPKMEVFAKYNAMPRYVVSTTLETDNPEWPATILRSVDDVAQLKESDGGPIIVHGSGALAQSLAEAGLVDRYHLLVFPVLLGAGRRLFGQPDMDAVKLDLVEFEAYDNGIQKNVFDVKCG